MEFRPNRNLIEAFGRRTFVHRQLAFPLSDDGSSGPLAGSGQRTFRVLASRPLQGLVEGRQRSPLQPMGVHLAAVVGGRQLDEVRDVEAVDDEVVAHDARVVPPREIRGDETLAPHRNRRFH